MAGTRSQQNAGNAAAPRPKLLTSGYTAQEGDGDPWDAYDGPIGEHEDVPLPSFQAAFAIRNLLSPDETPDPPFALGYFLGYCFIMYVTSLRALRSLLHGYTRTISSQMGTTHSRSSDSSLAGQLH